LIAVSQLRSRITFPTIRLSQGERMVTCKSGMAENARSKVTTWAEAVSANAAR
jgi:hypothetical protein